MDEASYIEALLADRDNDEHWLVYADWLTEQGNPRGELIVLHMRGLDKEASAFITRHREALLGTVALAAGQHFEFWWRRGFLDMIASRAETTPGDIKALLDSPSATFLRHLDIAFGLRRSDYESVHEILLDSPVAKRLESIALPPRQWPHNTQYALTNVSFGQRFLPGSGRRARGYRLRSFPEADRLAIVEEIDSDWMAWLAWAAKGDYERDPPIIDEDTQRVADRVAVHVPRTRETVRANGIRVLLWASKTEPVQRALLELAVDRELGHLVFDTMSSLDSLAYRRGDDAGSYRSAREIAYDLWLRCTPEDRLPLAASFVRGWSYGYAQDRNAMFELFWRRYVKVPRERAAIFGALYGLARSEGTNRFVAKHREELPDEPICGDDPARFFTELATIRPGYDYDTLQVTLQDASMARAPEILEAVFAKRRVNDSVTQQLPPFVLFARWLVGSDGDAAAADALERIWGEIVDDVEAPEDHVESYYFKEKKEEVAAAIAAVRERVRGG